MDQVSTSLEPLELLQLLKKVELELGRNKTIDNGPREIDLDILLYDHMQMDDTEVNLTIPHKRLHEREFVLRPLAE